MSSGLRWKRIECYFNVGSKMDGIKLMRTKVPGGWLIMELDSWEHKKINGIVFYPDPHHEWNGRSLD